MSKMSYRIKLTEDKASELDHRTGIMLKVIRKEKVDQNQVDELDSMFNLVDNLKTEMRQAFADKYELQTL